MPAFAVAFPMGGSLTPGTLCDDVFACVLDGAHAAQVEAVAPHFECSMTPDGTCTGWTCTYRNPGGPSTLDEAEIDEICRVTVIVPAPSLICRVYL